MDYYKKVPVPRLQRQGGAILQEKGFLEPKKPTIEAGAGRFEGHLKQSRVAPPAEFGPLTRVYQLPAVRRQDSKKMPKPETNVFVRRNRGTTVHRVWRSDSARYDDRKFNILRFPLLNHKNNWSYGKGQTTHGLDGLGKSMLRMAQWPYCPGVKTKAPFIWKVEEKPTLAAVELSNPLGQVVATPELFQIILANLVDAWEDLSNLSRTSQAMFQTISNHIARIDLRDSEYQSLSFLPPGHTDDSDAVKVDAETFSTLSIGPFMILGGIRHGWLNGHEPDPNIDYSNDYGVWEYPEDVKYKGQGVAKSMQGYLEFLQCIELRPSLLRHVLLQGVMFLDIHGVKAIIESSPALETIGIHNCEQLHFGTTKDLVQLISCENKNRSKDGKVQLELDFFPKYYQGPRHNSQGCYGVVWSDEGYLDTIRGVTAVLVTVIPLARKANIDLLRPGKALRLWLDKLPFRHRTLPYILDSILRLDDFREDGKTKVSKIQAEAMLMTLWSDIIIALKGQSMSQVSLEKIMSPREIGKGWLHNCGHCGGMFPSVFFKADIIDRDDETRICHGCQLLAYLNGQGHNYNSLHIKAQTTASLWDDGKIKNVHMLFKPEPEGAADNGKLSRIIEARLAACNIAHRRAVGIPQELTQATAALKAMRSKEIDRRFGSNQDTNQRDHVETWVQALQAELGVAQISPGTTAQPRPPAAASWQENISWYMATADEEAGRLLTSGPYAGVVNKASARKQIFW